MKSNKDLFMEEQEAKTYSMQPIIECILALEAEYKEKYKSKAFSISKAIKKYEDDKARKSS